MAEITKSGSRLTIEDARLSLVCPNATAEQLAAGLAAARRVFDAAGYSPREAAEGMNAREAWQIQGFRKSAQPSRQKAIAEDVWELAEEEAIAAVGIPLNVPPDGTRLIFRF